MKIPLGLPRYISRSVDAANIECLNMYPERRNPSAGTDNDYILIGTPGSTNIGSWDKSGILGHARGMYAASWGTLYAVLGNTLWSMFDENTPSQYIGTIGAQAGQAMAVFCDNGTDLAIAVDGQAFVSNRDTKDFVLLNIGGASTVVTPSHCAFLGGYIIWNNTFRDPSISDPPTNTVLYYSNLFDARTYDATLQFFTAEDSADPVIALEVRSDQLHTQGVRRYETFILSTSVTTSNPDPFVRIGTSTVQMGLYAAYATDVHKDVLYFLGTTPKGGVGFYQHMGGFPQKISDPSFDHSFEQGGGQDSVVFAYSMDGHDFVVVSSQSLAMTMVWDNVEKKWHRRSWHETSTGNELSIEANCAASINGIVYFGSRFSCRILKPSLNVYQEWDGTTIQRIHTIPQLSEEYHGIVHRKVTLEFESGTGSDIPDGLTNTANSPLITLEQSDNSGHVWNLADSQPMGVDGNYGIAVIWWRRGYARNRQYRIRSNANVKQVWIAFYIETTSLKR